MKNTHVVTKSFHAAEVGRIVAPGESFTPSDESRAGELERGKLIAPAGEAKEKAVPAAPKNKDAAKQRKNK